MYSNLNKYIYTCLRPEYVIYLARWIDIKSIRWVMMVVIQVHTKLTPVCAFVLTNWSSNLCPLHMFTFVALISSLRVMPSSLFFIITLDVVVTTLCVRWIHPVIVADLSTLYCCGFWEVCSFFIFGLIRDGGFHNKSTSSLFFARQQITGGAMIRSIYLRSIYFRTL